MKELEKERWIGAGETRVLLVPVRTDSAKAVGLGNPGGERGV